MIGAGDVHGLAIGDGENLGVRGDSLVHGWFEHGIMLVRQHPCRGEAQTGTNPSWNENQRIRDPPAGEYTHNHQQQLRCLPTPQYMWFPGAPL